MPQSPYIGAEVPPPPPLSAGPPSDAAGPPPAPPSPGTGAAKVALLVPLTGDNAALGQAMRDAALLALFMGGNDRLTLLPRDTGGTPQGAAAAARSAVADGAQLVLGPLLAPEVDAVRPILRDAKINVIAFSTQTQLAGGNVFLMGFLPRQEVAREVSFARERGLNRFAALAPNTAYGHLMADSLRELVGQAGGSFVRAEYLDPRAGDPAAVIRRLTAGRAARPRRSEAEPEAAAGAAPFDALLLPEGGETLKQIARQLNDAGIGGSQVRLLGSGLWDDPSIVGEPALYGGWFAASPPEPRREFESRFQATYGHPPPRLASLAFDAAALAVVLSRSSGAGGLPFTQDAILNPGGFTGVDGLFRFTRQGLVQRGLAVLEVQPQGAVVIGPAPQTFRDYVY